jgi:hypothetical protein
MSLLALYALHGFYRTNVGQHVTTVSEIVPITFGWLHAVVYPTGQIPGE